MSQELPLNGFYESTTPKNSRRRCVNLIPINEPNGSLSTNMLECPSGITGPIVQSETYTDFQFLRSPEDVDSQVFSFTGSATDTAAVFCNADKLIRVLYTTGGVLSWDYVVIPDFGGTTPYMQGCRFAASESYLVALSGSELAEGSLSTRGCAVQFSNTYTPTTIDLNAIWGAPHGIYDIAFLGGRFIYMRSAPGSGDRSCYYSDIGATTPDITNFFAPDIDYGRLTGLHVINGNLRLWDEKRCYLFTLTGSTTTPFQWQRSATLEVGLVGPHCKAECAGSLFFLGTDQSGKVQPYIMSGGISPIGTPAVIAAMNESGSYKLDFSTRQKVFAFSDHGRDYVAFNTLGKTFVYSLADNRWFEMSTNDSNWSVTGYVRFRDAGIYVGKTFETAGSPSTTVPLSLDIGIDDDSIGTEFGQQVNRFVDSAPFNANFQTIRLSELEPVCEVAGSSSESVYLSTSQDYGETFGAERSNVVSSGTTRNRFTNLGIYRQAVVVRIRFLSSYPTKIIKLMARMITGGRE